MLEDEGGDQLFIFFEDMGEGVVFGADEFAFTEEELHENHFFALPDRCRSVAVFGPR